MRKQNFSMGEIAAVIGKHKSTISRELRRNCDRRSGRYDADLAQRKCERRQKEKPHRVRFTEEVRLRVEAMLREDYSPEQIVGRCKLEGLECVSVETIYQHVWGDKRRGGDLHTHLRRKGRKYRKRGAKKDSRGVIRDRVSIDERPKVVDDKSRFGDLEIDLIMGANHRRALLSANDRASGISWIALLEGKDSKALAEKAAETLMPFKGLLHTITSDNGKEFAEHKAIAKSLAVDYYFAHPYHSWERGANENMNGLIRQYLPKGTSFDSLDDNEIKRIRDKLNNRPRKKLGYLTPIEYFFANFAPELNLSLTQKVAFVT
jgi:IS30 family transposase